MLFLFEEEYKKLVKNSALATVEAVVKYQNGILLIRRKEKPGQGEFWVPGGRIYKGEHPEEAVRRVVPVETGLGFEIERLGCISSEKFPESKFPGIDYHSIGIVYVGTGYGNVDLDENHEDFKIITSNEPDLHVYVRKILLDSRAFR